MSKPAYHIFFSSQQNASSPDKEIPFCKEPVVRNVGIAHGWSPPSSQTSQHALHGSWKLAFTFQLCFISDFERIPTVEIYTRNRNLITAENKIHLVCGQQLSYSSGNDPWFWGMEWHRQQYSCFYVAGNLAQYQKVYIWNLINTQL